MCKFFPLTRMLISNVEGYDRIETSENVIQWVIQEITRMSSDNSKMLEAFRTRNWRPRFSLKDYCLLTFNHLYIWLFTHIWCSDSFCLVMCCLIKARVTNGTRRWYLFLLRFLLRLSAVGLSQQFCKWYKCFAVPFPVDLFLFSWSSWAKMGGQWAHKLHL